MSSPDALYGVLLSLARTGQVCPRNFELGELVGRSGSTVTDYLRALKDEGRIEIDRSACLRVVHLIAEGVKTADPRPPELVKVRPPVRDIIASAAATFDTTAKDIVSKSRFAVHVRARKAVCLTAWNRGWTSGVIGKALGGRDHSTILHGRDSARALAPTDADFSARLGALDARVPQVREVML